MKSRAHLTEKGLLKICGIRDQMNYGKNKSKWTTTEVKEILMNPPEHIAVHSKPKQSGLIHNTIPEKRDWTYKNQGNHKKGLHSPKSEVECFRTAE